MQVLRLRIGESSPVKEKVFNCSTDVYKYGDTIKHADRETFIILHVSSKNQLIEAELHSIGQVDCSAVYPREIMRSALLWNSSALILIHNHPSGNPEPSECDKEITKAIVLASEMLSIKVLDHVIIGKDKYYSMGDNGLIEDYKFHAQQIMLYGKVGKA